MKRLEIDTIDREDLQSDLEEYEHIERVLGLPRLSEWLRDIYQHDLDMLVINAKERVNKLIKL